MGRTGASTSPRTARDRPRALPGDGVHRPVVPDRVVRRPGRRLSRRTHSRRGQSRGAAQHSGRARVLARPPRPGPGGDQRRAARGRSSRPSRRLSARGLSRSCSSPRPAAASGRPTGPHSLSTARSRSPPPPTETPAQRAVVRPTSPSATPSSSRAASPAGASVRPSTQLIFSRRSVAGTPRTGLTARWPSTACHPRVRAGSSSRAHGCSSSSTARTIGQRSSSEPGGRAGPAMSSARGSSSSRGKAPTSPSSSSTRPASATAARFNVSVLDASIEVTDGARPACRSNAPFDEAPARSPPHPHRTRVEPLSALPATRDPSDLLCLRPLDLKLSTAALLSARFPFVNPAGRVPSQCVFEPRQAVVHGVDGGYLDTSGASPIVELMAFLAPEIEAWNAEPSHAGTCIVPFMIQIDNGFEDTSPPRGGRRPAELLVPLQTVFDTRIGRAAERGPQPRSSSRARSSARASRRPPDASP